MAPPAPLRRLADLCRQLRLPYRTAADLKSVISELGCGTTDAACSVEDLARRADQLVPRTREDAVHELQRAVSQYKKRHVRPGAAAASAPATLVRQCRDAGVALVPCDPLGDTCPPADRLQGTPYENMYSVLGRGAAQFAVRCVPPEMVRLSQASQPKEALTVEQQERRLDQRLHAALGAVERGVPNVERLAGWTTRAPCAALAGSENSCARMRFSSEDAGQRCLYSGPARQCHDNLVETRKKVDAASMRIIHLVRRVRQRLRHMVDSTQEGSVEEALALVARGMEQQAHAEHVCGMYHKRERECADPDQQVHAGTTCKYDSVNKTCAPFTCNNLDEKQCKSAAVHADQSACHWDRLQDPPRCRFAQACSDRKTSKSCGTDNQCMWTGRDCRDGVDAVYHLMNVVENAEKQYGAHHANVHQHLADILVDNVMHDDIVPLRLRQHPPTATLTTPEQVQDAARKYRLGPAYVSKLSSELRRYGTAELQPPVLGGGAGTPPARKTVAGVVKVMAHALRQYNKVLRLGKELRRGGGPAFQSALRLDAACPAGGNCAAPGRHRATRHITWDRPPPAAAGATVPTSRVNLDVMPAFQEPVLELEPREAAA